MTKTVTFKPQGFFYHDDASYIPPGYIDAFVFEDFDNAKTHSRLLIMAPERNGAGDKKVFLVVGGSGSTSEYEDTLNKLHKLYKENPRQYLGDKVTISYEPVERTGRYDEIPCKVIFDEDKSARMVIPLILRERVKRLQGLQGIPNYGIF